MSDTQIVPTNGSNWDRPGSLDEYITGLCLDKTFNDIIKLRESAPNARAFYAATLIFNAVMEEDIGAIYEIIERIDGTVPTKQDREKYANLIGDALEDVMDKNVAIVGFDFSDVVIIAIAKTILYVATMECGRNPNKKKDRQKANEIVLKRTGGRRSEPVKEAIAIEYVEPDWMYELPEA